MLSLITRYLTRLSPSYRATMRAAALAQRIETARRVGHAWYLARRAARAMMIQAADIEARQDREWGGHSRYGVGYLPMACWHALELTSRQRP